MVRPPSTLPESVLMTVTMELDRLDETGVIIKVDEPTDCVHQISVVKRIYVAADSLSRAFLPAMNVQTQTEFETINTVTFLPIREESITNIGDETERDESLHTLKRVIQQCWPQDNATVPSLAAPTIISQMNLL